MWGSSGPTQAMRWAHRAGEGEAEPAVCGWGTWIRTKIDGVRVRSSTVELSPIGAGPEARAAIAEGLAARKGRDGALGAGRGRPLHWARPPPSPRPAPRPWRMEFWVSTNDRTRAGATGGAEQVHASAANAPGDDHARAPAPTYAALDLGTNNCRLLVARPSRDGFRIVDAFSRIVRLGEGLSQTGLLGGAAMDRTLSALEVCRDKMEQRGVGRARLIATEACRIARNGPKFIDTVRDRVGLSLEIVDRETEAHLAAAGCASLADPEAEGVVLFDIGGGSSEIVWLGRASDHSHAADARDRVRVWASLRLGVVTIAEKFGGFDVSSETYERMVDHVYGRLGPFVERAAEEPRCERFHLLGTSGTVTTIAGVHLGLQRYERRRVDGLWMNEAEISAAIATLRGMTYDQRAANGCIGAERADLVLAGCAIFDAIRRAFPAGRVRIADRGLREGILMQMMSDDGVWSPDRNAEKKP